MIIGIWRTRRHPAKTFEAFEKFQREVVLPELKEAKGCLGAFNFHTDTEWGTLQIWESRAAEEASETSPAASRLRDKLQAAGILSADDSYEWFEVHHGFAHWDLLKHYIRL